WSGPRMQEDINDAMFKSDLILRKSSEVAGLNPGQPLSLRQIIGGWVAYYDQLDQGNDNLFVKLDYPPMRSLVLTLWMRHVQAEFPGLANLPPPPPGKKGQPTSDVVRPMLEINTLAEGISALSMFFLVWFWSNRGGKRLVWGDPLLLAPPALLAGMLVLRPLFG